MLLMKACTNYANRSTLAGAALTWTWPLMQPPVRPDLAASLIGRMPLFCRPGIRHVLHKIETKSWRFIIRISYFYAVRSY